MQSQLRSINCNNVKIEYYLTRKRVKNVNLRIRSTDGTVHVSASPYVKVGFIDEFVRANAGFIMSALSKYEEERLRTEHFAANEVKDGGEVFLLGEKLAVSIKHADRESIEVADGKLTINVRDINDSLHCAALWKKRLDIMRSEVFNRLFDNTFEVFVPLGVKKPVLITKNAVSRWGYCQPVRGVVMMNKQLICVPLPLIEYLVLHELTHLLYPNHSKQFWGFMQQLMPDCKQRRKALQSYAFLLIKDSL